ncbi:CC0125/CC1285 family lipoprotein [Pelagibacterium montanilacus]|uniref:CC0125/CC1285 family lipoprotein n=1 Tax=Pelagibacterium montanilacus TaxID=2185280 RepID=UPI000F8E27DF|nr:hypothetical protein [Pelagibacterium montanilacus]
MKNVFKVSAAVLMLVAIQACSTTYGDMGAMGGVAAVPITSDTYRISARGNGFTDPTTIQDYSLLKAAETTLQNGHTHFGVVSSADASRTSLGQTPGTMQTNIYGNTAYSTFTPGTTYTINQPGEDLLVRIFTPGPGQSASGAFKAQEVFDSINPRVERSGS